MIIKSACIIILSPLLYDNFHITKDNYAQYKPYTTTSMVDTQDPKFYENFWNSIIKEDCDSNSMVE
jgi:hypothetical protein